MLGDRSFAKRQILSFDHGYAIESLPAAQPALPRPATVAQLADAAPAEDVAAPKESGHSVPSWVANDRKVQAQAFSRCSCGAWATWIHTLRSMWLSAGRSSRLCAEAACLHMHDSAPLLRTHSVCPDLERLQLWAARKRLCKAIVCYHRTAVHSALALHVPTGRDSHLWRIRLKTRAGIHVLRHLISLALWPETAHEPPLRLSSLTLCDVA